MFTKIPEGAKPQAAASAASQRPAETKIDFRYLDRPECLETFADSLTGLLFDGQTLRLEFGVSRLDERKPDAPLTGRRYPVCRLVLPPAAALDLISKMQQVAAALAQTGMVKPQNDTAR